MVKRTSFIALLLVMTPMIQGSSFKDVLYAALQQFSKRVHYHSKPQRSLMKSPNQWEIQ